MAILRTAAAALGGAVLLATIMAGAPAMAAGQGCEALSWPMAREQAALKAADQEVASGSRVATGTAVVLKLAPLAAAKLPASPERAPKNAAGHAGYLRAAVSDGVLAVSISHHAWIDVLQGDRYLVPAAFTGAEGCPGLRKNVRFTVSAGEAIVQISGVAAGAIAVMVDQSP